MQKILTIVLIIAVIFALQPWQIDVVCAGDNWDGMNHEQKRCDLSGLWLMEADPETGFQATSYFIPLDPAKKRYAIPTKFVVPPQPLFEDDETTIPAGGVAKRISPCTFIGDGYWYGVSSDGVRLFDVVLYGIWSMEDKDTAIATFNSKVSLPDGTIIGCAETETIWHRLTTDPPSEWPCPEE